MHSKPFARASLLLIGLAWTLPFLQPYHRFPLTGFYSEWIAFALGLAAMLVLLGRQPWREAALPVVAIAPVGLVLVLGLQVALARVVYPEQVITATMYLLWASLLVLLAHVLRRELGIAAIAGTLAWFLFAGGALSVLIALLQHFQISTPLDLLIVQKSGAQGYGNLGQPNHFSTYVTLALASTAYLYGCGRLRGALAAMCVALFLLALAVSGSRSSWLYLGTLTVLAVALRRFRRDAGSQRLAAISLWLLPGFAAANWVVTLPFMAPHDNLLLTSAQRLFQLSSGIQPRLQLWGEAGGIFLAEPFLGAGWGQYSWHHFLQQAGAGPGINPGVYNHAHNIVMQLMAETGMLGTLLIVGAIMLWFADLRIVKLDLEWWWLLALLGVIGIHSLLEYPLWYAYFLGIAAVLLGLGAERTWAPRRTGAVRAVVGLGIIVGWVNLAAVISPYRDFERLVFTPQSRHSPAVGDKVFEDTIVGIHREPLLAPYVELAMAYGVTVSEEQLREKLELTTRAMHFAPTSVVVYRHALLLALSGESAAALRQLEWAMRAYPEDIQDIVAELGALADRRPDAFAPLLELASARLRK